jgi:hypothetical protein
MMDGAHAAADVEDGLSLDTARGEGVDQHASQTLCALLTVGAKALRGVAGVELAIEPRVAG